MPVLPSCRHLFVRIASGKNQWCSEVMSLRVATTDLIYVLSVVLDEYINAQKQANGFDLRYTETMSPSEKDWRDCSNVLSRRDFTELKTSGWSESK
ncbi:Uncharacterised protein [Shewanella baltica]|uniref:hypothetical protein n=1 Tax=Shewanella TaxID=22 RepID=UPI000D3A1FD8|nr:MULTISPECIES: hypothetical protein [Shewanella]VEF26290.1 Uncharacterised protein [Shewanella baltica]